MEKLNICYNSLIEFQCRLVKIGHHGQINAVRIDYQKLKCIFLLVKMDDSVIRNQLKLRMIMKHTTSLHKLILEGF